MFSEMTEGNYEYFEEMSNSGGEGGDSNEGNGSGDEDEEVEVEEPCKPEEVKVSLTVSNSKITLMDEYGLSAHITPANAKVFKIMFIVSKLSGDPHGVIMHEGLETECKEPAIRPGKLKVKVIVDVGPYVVASNEEIIEVQFPTYNDIVGNASVALKLQSIWSGVILDTMNGIRKEKGCWIYLNTSTGNYEYEDIPDGPTVTGCEDTRGSIPITRPTRNSPSLSPIKGGVYPVALFHTHTAITHCPSDKARIPVGPSEKDEIIVNGYEMVGIVYDYVGSYDFDRNKYGIKGGHAINAPAKMYHCGKDRVPTPSY